MPQRFTLLTRPGCHLCEALESEALALFGERLDIELVQVDHHPDWLAQYGLRIPVLLDAQGRLVCELQLDAEALALSLRL